MPIPVRVRLAAVAGLVLLAGCSGPSTAPTSAPAASAPAASAPAGSSDQSLLDACTTLSASMNDATATMNSALADIGKDPDKAVKALRAFQDTFDQSVAKVTNPELRAQADKALAATKGMVSALEAITKDPTKLAGFSDTMAKFEDEMTKIGTVCAG